MTIRFLQQWNGYDEQDIVTLSGEEETRLVGLGLATYTILATQSEVTGLRAQTISSADLTTLRQQILINPSLAPTQGDRYILTDGLLANTVVYFTGDSFQPGSTVYANNPLTHIAERLSNNSTDTNQNTVIFDVTIPGFLLGARSVLNIYPSWEASNDGTKVLQVKAFQGGSQASTTIASMPTAPASTLSVSHHVRLSCANDYYNQRVSRHGAFGNDDQVFPRLNINTQVDFQIQFAPWWTSNRATTQSIKLVGLEITL